MCGILGIVNNKSSKHVQVEELTCMLETIAHRGPDSSGVVIGGKQGQLGLGHVRLSIVDLRAGQQPMASEDGNAWLVFNGELYNHKALHQAWLPNYQPKSSSDTEILLELLREHGTKILPHLNGIFAFAYWDRRTDQVLVARDHIGVKPIYYTNTDQGFVFASEAKAIIAHQPATQAVHWDSLIQYLTYSNIWQPNSLFEGIKTLPAGHYITVEPDGDLQIVSYWHPFNQPLAKPEPFSQDGFEALIKDAVGLQLMSDVPLGAYVTGGIDSSTVAAMAVKSTPDLKTFVAVFDSEDSRQELHYSQKVAEGLKTNHHVLNVADQKLESHLPQILWHLDEPRIGAAILPQYLVSGLVKSEVTVVLGGQGGDEVYGGYARYLLSNPLKTVGKVLAQRLKSALGVGAQESVPSTAHKQLDKGGQKWLKDNIQLFLSSMEERYVKQLSPFDSPESIQVLRDQYYNAIRNLQNGKQVREILTQVKSYSALQQVMFLEQQTYLQGLLHLEDRLSMAHSLESRVPLLDYRLIEMMSHAPDEAKMQGFQTKVSLKKLAAKHISREVIERRKMGFPTPLSRWINTSNREWILSVLLDKNAWIHELIHKERLEAYLNLAPEKRTRRWEFSVWMYLCLELWHQMFITNTLSMRSPVKLIQPKVVVLDA
ncbi:MAG: asparagine synthase (glutamine-hydrolyzing) [Bacteroidetes Order II. Incertae sedis bacterium]|nr:asparagine synthase (glutamine-hydrolyzing) [Bacteroidetes Order II. bacterium]